MAAQPPPPRDALRTLARIARDHGGTRAAGTPGGVATSEYVAQRLRAAGFGVERQRVTFPYSRVASARLSVGGRAQREGRGFRVPAYSGSGRAAGAARRSDPGCGRDGFSGLRSGEIPVVRDGDCRFREQAQNAARAGARALVIAIEASRRGVGSATLGGPGVSIPVVLVPLRAEPAQGARLALAVTAPISRAAGHNVIAQLPAKAAGPVVMAGGHLDSVPAGPGLNDNGSGIAALLRLADSLAARPPDGPVRLGFWAAEELGLLGSRHYVRSLSEAERSRISAYVNLDMVGSPNPVPSVYSDGDPGLARVLRRALGRRVPGKAAAGSSDHAPFQEAGIRVNGLYTGSQELRRGRPRDPCYHLACDTLGERETAPCSSG